VIALLWRGGAGGVVDGEMTAARLRAVSGAAEHARLHAAAGLTAARLHAHPVPFPAGEDPALALAHHTAGCGRVPVLRARGYGP
ncbi:hypothetical protein HLK59_09840, partial [Streptomyces sp. S3(2020)]|nr:hypothetical protein [Streptomyces sp. S3(2020)]